MASSWRRLRWPALLATAGFLAASFAASPSRTVEASNHVTLRIGVTQTATETGLNPFLATAAADYRLLADVYDLLLEFGPTLQPAPGLAERWEQSEDGLAWTYTMRDGATWHDGQPVTAEDVVFTFDYIRNSQNPAYTGPAAPDGNDLPGEGETESDGSADNPITLFDNALDLDAGFEETRITSISAPSPRTVVIETSEPLIIMSQIYIPILPKHIWETIPYAESANDFANYDPARGLPVGSGPYILKEFRPDEFVRLEGNDAYWGGAPKVDTLIYQYFENDEAAIQALLGGDVDMLTEVPPALVSALEGNNAIELVQAESSDFIELGFNSWTPSPERFADEGCADCPRGPTTGSMGNPWLTRAEVRRALSGLIDKQELVERALSGYGTPGDSVVGPFNPNYFYDSPADHPANFPPYTDENSRATARQQAVSRFRAALAALGFSDTDGDGILNVPDTAEARAFDPVHAVDFSDTGTTEVGAGRNFKLRLFVRDDDEEDKVAAELIEAWFEDAGVDVDRQLVKEDPQLYDATYPSSTNADMDMYIWGWGPDPDPDFILSIFACNQINNWQDVNYCDPEYDTLYRASRVADDLDERRQIILSLQERIFDQAPYSVLWYTDTLSAYRSDRWEGFNQHPEGGGEIWGAWGFGPYQSRLTVAPLGTSVSPDPSAPTGSPGSSPDPGAPTGGGSTPLILVAVAAIVIIGVGVVLAARRRVSADDEE